MNKANTICLWFLTAIFCLYLAACSRPGNTTSGFADLPSEGWSYNNTLTFNLQHTDSVASGILVAAFRHNADYPYTNLVYEVSTPERKDTVSLNLADHYGKWRGSGIGVSYQITDTLGQLRHLSGQSVRIRHLMRCDTLPGISQVGVFFIAG